MGRKIKIQEIKDFCKSIGLECISDNYISIKHDLEFICTQCGKHFFRNFDNIKTRKKTICNNCSSNNIHKDQSFGYDYVKDFVKNNSECILLDDEYFNVDSKMNFKCKCGNNFNTTFYTFRSKNKRQCDKCGRLITKNKLLTKESDIIKMVELEGYRYYKNDTFKGDQKIFIQCDKKHDPYWVRVSKFKHGRRCPHCQRSLGEEFLELELQKYNINYKHEYSFNDLKGIGGGLLRYDFAIIVDDGVKILIEYDGSQHFELAFNCEETFRRTQIHDKMKDDFAKINNIPLFRIPHTEYKNIPQIVEKIINEIIVLK